MPSPTLRPASILSLSCLPKSWQASETKEDHRSHFKQQQCSAKWLLKLGSVFTACQVLLGQTGLPDNPRDGFLNYRLLSAPAGLREGHAPSPALHPTQDGDGGAAVQARWIWARMSVWGTEPRACPSHSDLIVVLISTVHRPECDTEGKCVPGAQGLALRWREFRSWCWVKIASLFVICGWKYYLNANHRGIYYNCGYDSEVI